MQKNDFAGTHESLGEAKGADDVVSDNAAGVSNDMCFTVFQPENLEDIHPRVHTSNYC